MKVAEPSAVPLPGRKPEASGARVAVSGGFSAVLADTGGTPIPTRKPEAPIQLANGQSVPPLPTAKPVVPLVLADGGAVPLPGRKPAATTAQTVAAAPLPAQKPDAEATAVAGAPVPATKPDVPETTSTEMADAARITAASRQVARLSGHSFGAILAQATMESGLNPAAKSRTSSAAGPFQFLERTWLDLMRRHGSAYGLGDLAGAIESRNGIPVVKDAATRQQILDLRHDVDLAAGMAARYMAEGRERLSRSLKRPVSESESRMAYILGVGGAARLIRAAERTPDAAAADLLPAAARANRPLFYDAGSGRALGARETVGRLAARMTADQRNLFAAIDKAAESPVVLDGRPSPLSPFRSAGSMVEDAAAGSTIG